MGQIQKCCRPNRVVGPVPHQPPPVVPLSHVTSSYSGKKKAKSPRNKSRGSTPKTKKGRRRKKKRNSKRKGGSESKKASGSKKDSGSKIVSGISSNREPKPIKKERVPDMTTGAEDPSALKWSSATKEAVQATRKGFSSTNELPRTPLAEKGTSAPKKSNGEQKSRGIDQGQEKSNTESRPAESLSSPLLGRPEIAARGLDNFSDRHSHANSEVGANTESLEDNKASGNEAAEEAEYDYNVPDRLEIKFKPGTMGCAYTPDMIIDALQHGGQAESLGVQIGFRILSLNGENYNSEAMQIMLKDLGEKGKERIIVFDTVPFKIAIVQDLEEQKLKVPKELRKYQKALASQEKAFAKLAHDKMDRNHDGLVHVKGEKQLEHEDKSDIETAKSKYLPKYTSLDQIVVAKGEPAAGSSPLGSYSRNDMATLLKDAYGDDVLV